jgi:hypothetical protein
MTRMNPAGLREAAEKVLARNPRSYRQFLMTLQGAQRASDLIPLVMQVLADAAQVAALKPLPKPPAPETGESLPLFRNETGAPGGAMVARGKPADAPSRWSYPVKALDGPWLLPQAWVDEWAKDYGLEFVEGCLLAAKTWVSASGDRRKTAVGMRRFLAGWIARQWDNGGGRRTAGAGSAGGTRSAPSPLGKSNATMARMLAEAGSAASNQEVPF